MAVTAALEGEAAKWVADLHSKHTWELGNAGLFLEALQGRFKDATRAQWAEEEFLSLKQRGRPVVKYIREFRQIAGKLQIWSKQLLVYHFKVGLDSMLRQACAYQGSAP